MSSEDYYEQVDPVEKEWAHALIDGRLDIIHQLILSDVSYINKKGFLNVSVPLSPATLFDLSLSLSFHYMLLQGWVSYCTL